ncbi:MAG: hypothetical protein RugAbin2_01506 [Rugosibacter sp.]|nr:hypothetical protein [Rugosibacter sp.]
MNQAMRPAHSDPYPGNVFYLPGNRISFIGFGMVGRLAEERRDQLMRLLLGLVKRDSRHVADDADRQSAGGWSVPCVHRLFQGDESLDQQRKVDREREQVLAQDGHQIVEHDAQARLFQRHAVVLVDEGLDFQQQAIFVHGAVADPVEHHVIAALIIGASIVMTVPGGSAWLGLPFFGLLGFVGAVIGSIWLLLSIWRSGGKE